MSAGTVLEGRYRRLLRIYPAGHRRKHQDEMLGVLMAGARAAQHRPGPADTANLIWGALLIRLRPARPGTAWPLWRDALAVVSVQVLGGWAIVATLALLRLRRTAALAAVALLIWLAYSSADAPNWSYIDAPSMRWPE